MTRYFVDTEFIEDGKTIDLISIGIVCEDGREYYAQLCEYDPRKASSWVKENVLRNIVFCPNYSDLADSQPYLHRDGQCLNPDRSFLKECPWRDRTYLQHEIKQFFNSEKIELWSWCGSYDHVALCQLFGTMVDVPSQFPHYIKDLQYVLDEHGISDDELPQQEGRAHNALYDAKHIEKLWGHIVMNDAWQ